MFIWVWKENGKLKPKDVRVKKPYPDWLWSNAKIKGFSGGYVRCSLTQKD